MSLILDHIDASPLADGRFIIAGASDGGRLRIGHFSGDTTVWDTPIITFDTGTNKNVKVVGLDATHFLLVYSDGSTDYGVARVGHWGGQTSIIWDTPEATFQHTIQAMGAGTVSVCRLSPVEFALAYIDEGDSNKIKLRIGSYQAGAIVWKTTSEWIVDTSSCALVGIAALDYNKVVVSYIDTVDSNRGYVRIGTWSGNDNFSFNMTRSSFSTVGAACVSVANLGNPGVNKFVVAFQSTVNSKGYVRIGSFVSGQFSWATDQTEFLDSTAESITVKSPDFPYFIVICKDIDEFDRGKSRLGYWDGSVSIEWATDILTFRHSNVNYLALAIISLSHFIVAYKDDGLSHYSVITRGQLGTLDRTTSSTSTTSTTNTSTTTTSGSTTTTTTYSSSTTTTTVSGSTTTTTTSGSTTTTTTGSGSTTVSGTTESTTTTVTTTTTTTTTGSGSTTVSGTTGSGTTESGTTTTTTTSTTTTGSGSTTTTTGSGSTTTTTTGTSETTTTTGTSETTTTTGTSETTTTTGTSETTTTTGTSETTTTTGTSETTTTGPPF
jgi:hypothetical protein